MNIDEKRFLVVLNVARVTYIALLLVLFYGCWTANIDSVAAKLVLWLCVSSGLLLVFPGVLKAAKRSFLWLCFILLIYFIWCVQSLFILKMNPDHIETGSSIFVSHEGLMLILVVVAFVVSMLVARWHR